MNDFGLTEAQSLDDLENLVMFAKDAGVSRIIYSAAKIVRARGGMDETMKAMLEVYREIAAPDKLKCTGGTWRLPLPVVKEHIEAPFLEICNRLGVKAAFCMHDLVAAGKAGGGGGRDQAGDCNQRRQHAGRKTTASGRCRSRGPVGLPVSPSFSFQCDCPSPRSRCRRKNDPIPSLSRAQTNQEPNGQNGLRRHGSQRPVAIGLLQP